METTVTIRTTDELTSQELIKIMAERVKVFVVEQECAYQEVDQLDFKAQHVLITRGAQLVAYARIVPNEDPDYISFGRVLVVQQFRGQHLASQLVQATLDEIAREYGPQPVKIAAQSYLQRFYGSFGFRPVSNVYLEDGIPHVDMVLERQLVKKD
ncbi:GNAT family N-acetyltransferase [Levilactobacillus bambusae]|uniref:GNAT family N-acetyltransferase n=1 Tax=Levilactobacillus bambusae TaxID=2024736 RepID=A0A2V1MZJ4_9LACO|nr:GNAT family N-acetyltransferase [Levilactobacillus bambusae]PWG00434.1 GNAT family N-acetyltransferase [Levilactobacillus bambusae]